MIPFPSTFLFFGISTWNGESGAGREHNWTQHFDQLICVWIFFFHSSGRASTEYMNKNEFNSFQFVELNNFAIKPKRFTFIKSSQCGSIKNNVCNVFVDHKVHFVCSLTKNAMSEFWHVDIRTLGDVFGILTLFTRFQFGIQRMNSIRILGLDKIRVKVSLYIN